MNVEDERSDPLLSVRNLELDYFSASGTVRAVRGVDLDIAAGETVGLVGESGSGKSAVASAIMGLVELPGRIGGGDIRWKGRSTLGPENKRYMDDVRGRDITMVFQDPMTSLDPFYTVGNQISEALRWHLGMSRDAAKERVIELLDLVGIAAPDVRAKRYPHELSGGMRQRVIIAMALACEPELLIADEPTTALDVTIQAQILDLLRDLQRELGLAILLISHDLGVIAEMCDRVAVMYAGRMCEMSTTAQLFSRPQHPYTLGLLRATPRLDLAAQRLETIPGSAPDMKNPPPGCAFHPRCPLATQQCTHQLPELIPIGSLRETACLNYEAIADQVRFQEVLAR